MKTLILLAAMMMSQLSFANTIDAQDMKVVSVSQSSVPRVGLTTYVDISVKLACNEEIAHFFAVGHAKHNCTNEFGRICPSLSVGALKSVTRLLCKGDKEVIMKDIYVGYEFNNDMQPEEFSIGTISDYAKVSQ